MSQLVLTQAAEGVVVLTVACKEHQQQQSQALTVVAISKL